jgi:abortive infection bacteriophage resistance protein
MAPLVIQTTRTCIFTLITLIGLKRVEDSVAQSHETFVKHFKEKYTSERHLPIWMICEVISFGQISQLFKGLRKHDRQAIAREKFQVDQKVMISWLHTLVYVRNLCAHHCRIWNRTLAIRPKILHRSSKWWNVRNDKLFCIILVLKHLTNIQHKWDEWTRKLFTLLETFSYVDTSKMGFPDNWKRLISGF